MNTKSKEETFWQKEKRLKSRKQAYKMTYKKGVYYMAYQRLQGYIGQPDVLIRVHASGSLDDETAFLSITIEGFKESENGI